MPEGHAVHRFADRFGELFLGSNLEIDSPQGRFTDGKLITGRKLTRSYAVGKQMFLEFENELTLRIHLGIYGKWTFHEADEKPDAVGQIRARFAANGHVVELRGPTVCEVIEPDAVRQVLERLGPDPLNANPRGIESNRFLQRVLGSKTAIGLLLMNQDVISGIGNVYRAEILFRAGVSPHRAGESLTREQVKAIWDDSVKLLKVGVKTGTMITIERLFSKSPEKEDRNFVYKREGQPCRKCGTSVSIEMMAGRKLYWCASCQK
ncbi:MAG: hypothetical protein RLZ71_540 [Actinomycetota bacterium]|jgi:DNA-formamidopyrimidine glycosylase